jgi:tetratricopeptide (TPR) repeat protein
MKPERTDDLCIPFQVDLSCMVDRELEDGGAVRRAVVHLEVCARCRRFFEAIEGQVRLHRELADPDRLLGGIAAAGGADLFARFALRESLRRLAAVLYRLGKAYLLLAVDRNYLLEVFEEPVTPTDFKSEGYRWVSLQVEREIFGRRESWTRAKHLLNGKLDSVPDNLAKARALLEESLVVRPNFAEPRLYLGFHRQVSGDLDGAEIEYRRVFRTARKLANRVHAAVQLGMVHHDRGDYRRAVACYRWVRASGVLERDDRFFFVYYNLGLVYARLGNLEAAVEAFRALRREHPDRLERVRSYLEKAQEFRDLLAERPEFRRRLEGVCGEIFAA